MVNAQLDVLELEFRKLQGVRTVGFSSQHDVLYIQLFVAQDAQTTNLPFEATRVAQRHSSSPVAVEIVRWADTSAKIDSAHDPSTPRLADTGKEVSENSQSIDRTKAGSIGSKAGSGFVEQAKEETQEPEQEAVKENDILKPYIDEDAGENEEVDLTEQEDTPVANNEDEQNDDSQDNEDDQDFEHTQREDSKDRIVLIAVTTSAGNDEIEVHLTLGELRTIGRAPTNRGLLGAIDATVDAIEELTGVQDFHAEWARSLEPGPEHASLVAIGLTNSEGTDTRHGIAGGESPIDAAARATLNALNRVTELVSSN